jgi:tRNA nucleotidyltransferase/poly(A) polymerase
MTYDNFLKLLDEFEEIQSFTKKIEFANRYFQRIGSGSGRIVYDIDGTKVFKLAKNAKGVAQNEAEINIGSYHDTHNIVTKVLESNNNGSWIISEKAKKVNESRIRQLTGIPSLNELYYFLRNHENNIKGGRNIFSLDADTEKLLNDNEFVTELQDIMSNYSISSGDLGRPSTYGEVLRDGQPTIVLTDYGLTGEVYDTHYNPSRKNKPQYRMYELYNNNDGNDDILGDMPPQDAIDTRRGMWAQIPYSVGDGPGVINEGFISFILDRDKYPTRILPSAPYIVDEFHNCVNNIDENLNHVKNKKKFYENLLKLQEYLIEQKFYDREPLGEILYLNEDGSALYSTDNAMGQDNFPVHNNIDTSPSIRNDLDANRDKNNEDLEYHNVVGDATKDQYMLDERQLSSMAGSSTVEVKQKCRLAGNGNTSTACNQGDIRNLNIKPLKEEISASEAYTEQGAIKTVLNGKRKIGFVHINKPIAQKLEKLKIGVIPIRMTSQNTMTAIIYRDKVKAYLLYEIAKRHGGYLDDKTPEEAREIGRLLEYKEKDIEDFIRKNYSNKVPTMPEKSPDDYNDLAEDVSLDFWDLNEMAMDYDNAIGTFEVTGSIVGMRYFLNDIKKIDPSLISQDNNKVFVNFEPKHHDQISKLAQKYNMNVITNNKIAPQNNFNLSEENFPEFEKDIQQDLTTHQLDKKYIRSYQDGEHTYNVYAVNGDEVRDSGFIEWVDGGNHWVDADLPKSEQKYAKHIGENDYWVDDVFMIKPADFEAILLHERIESFIIRHYGYEYDDAHNIANKIELMFRKKIPDGANRALAEKIYDTFVVNFKPEKSKQKHKPANESIEMLNEGQIMALNYLPFKEDVEEAGGKIYSVGGAVRDEFLGKESKDLDILITGVPFEQLEEILGKYGAVNAVGKSFGVLKFKPKGATEDIDIAIPRTETPTGEGGHQGFDVKSDHALPIEKDLERRDFTINAIAKDAEGNIIDPFGGQEDLKNKVIKVVNPQAFSDDPLRMLRAVQFASRFGFTIEPETMKMIQENAGRVKEIAPERILTEFEKIVRKGNILTGAILLNETGLLKEIFGKGLYYDFRNTKEPFDKVRTIGEFVYLLSKNLVNDPAEFFKTNFKGDENTYKEIKALQLAFDSGEATNLIEARSVVHNMYIISPISLQSQILPNVIMTAAKEFLAGKYPKTVNELAVNGNDLMQAGLQGKAIGDMQKSLLLKIYANKVMNNKEDLLSLAKENGR